MTLILTVQNTSNSRTMATVYNWNGYFNFALDYDITNQVTNVRRVMLQLWEQSCIDAAIGLQCKSKKSPLGDLTFFHCFHKWLRICNRFFTHLLNVPIFARLQIFIQLSPTLTKLCHIKRDYQVHIICTKCPKRTKTRAFRRLRKSLIALLIVVCGQSL